MIALLAALAGGLGAVTRFLLDDAVARRGWSRRLPAGTVLINVTGSFALGLVVGLVRDGAAADAWRQVLGVGFLGGYTTFSTASVEVVRLAREDRPRDAALVATGQLVASLLAAAAGLVLAGAF